MSTFIQIEHSANKMTPVCRENVASMDYMEYSGNATLDVYTNDGKSVKLSGTPEQMAAAMTKIAGSFTETVTL